MGRDVVPGLAGDGRGIVAAPVEGWRAWRLRSTKGLLEGVGRPFRWRAARLEAEHSRLYDNGTWTVDHAAPAFDCHCGFWMFKDTASLPYIYRRTYVFGRVKGWGRVVEHERGYRVQHIQIVELFSAHPLVSQESLAQVYKVPVREIDILGRPLAFPTALNALSFGERVKEFDVGDG